MALRPISRTIQTLFLDLAQKVETADAAGSLYVHRTSAGDYVYRRRRIGSRRVDDYLGRADDDLTRERVALNQEAALAAKERKRTVQLLRRSGLAAPDAVMGPMLHSVSDARLFANGAVLVGTGAYLMMEPLVGALLPAPTLMTDDLDLAMMSLTLSAEPPQAMLDILRRADPSFIGVPQLDNRKLPSRFKNRQGYLVDLITPTLRRDDSNPMPLDALAAGAAPLPYLRWLIADPVATVALWGEGIGVAVPQPARYAVHKLILAQKRFSGSRAKRGKDLTQAQALMEALRASDPFALEEAIEDARGQGRAGWSDPIDRSLAEIAGTV